LITGLLIVDNHDNLYFNLPSVVRSKDLSHYEYFKGISEEAVVLYGRTAFGTKDMFPPAESSIPEVNKTITQIQREYPYRPILVVGNHKVIKNMKYLNDLIVVKYYVDGNAVETCPNTKWIEPVCADKRLITLNPWYSITQYKMDPCHVDD
jgi:hypothetical protein